MRVKNTLLFLALFLTLSPAKTGFCTMRHETKIRVGAPPYEVLAEIINSNMQRKQQINRHKTAEDVLYFAWLADSDPRINPDMLLADSRNKIYSMRNLGFQIASALETVDFGILHLHAPILLITGNNDNQAIKSALQGFSQLDPDMQKQLQPLRTIVLPDDAKKKLNREEFSNLLHEAVEKNVDYQVNLALKRYGGRLKNGRLVVIGGILDLTDAYGLGKGRLIIINVNGETNDNVLRQHIIMTKFDKQMLEAVGRKPRKKPNTALINKQNSE